MTPAARMPAAWWVRHSAVILALTAAVFVQEPGRTAADTKLDLTENPWGMLGRALHLWEPLGAFGQVQNQAYGYLFPMGPFFGVLRSAHVPAWVVERLWWATLLSLAYVGITRVARALLGEGEAIAMVAGLAYALSPRLLTIVSPVSAEALPMVMAPWVLLPLLHHERLGTRRAAAFSGLAILCCGGVNAAALLAVLPIPLLYLLTRKGGAGRRRLLASWLGAVALASLWWLVPLLILRRLSPPFLDWIESASVTTSITSPATALRGASQWVAYLSDLSGPTWRGGWLLVAQPAFILDTMLVAAVGLAGLALPRCRERLFLMACLVVGLVAITFGHLAPLDGTGAVWARGMLDGPLAPFRNVHKFDPLMRLPLSLGVAVTIGSALDTWRSRPGGRHASLHDPAWAGQIRRTLGVSAVAVTVLALIGCSAPLITRQFVQRGSYDAVPAYWTEAGDWLSTHSWGGRSLVVPGASFSDSYWGRTRDEPLQAQGDVLWAVRDAIPLAPAGTIRWLNAVQVRLATGTTSPGLADALARAGVRYLVVRNDLDYAVAGAPRPILVHQAIALSGGLVRVQTFGPSMGGGSIPGVVLDRQLDRPYPAVEVYEVQRSVAQAVLITGSPERLAGGPEGLLDTLDANVGVAPATVLTGLDDAVTVTDTPRRREVGMGRVDDAWSATLSAADPLRLDAPAPDYLSSEATPRPVTAEPQGAIVSVSSSASDAGSPGGTEPEHQSYAAVDGDPATSWVSQPGLGALGAWIDLRFPSLVDPKGTRLRLDMKAGVPPSKVRVDTDSGSITVDVSAMDPAGFVLPVPDGATSYLRVSVQAVGDGSDGSVFAVSELTVPGVAARRPLTLASTSTPQAIVLTVPHGWQSGCVFVGTRPLCSPDLPRAGEEDLGIDRLVGNLPPHAQAWATFVPNPSAALDSWITRGTRLSVTASSSAVRDPSAAPYSAFDGDLGTGWVAGASDRDPSLTITYSSLETVTGVRLSLDPDLAASRPTSVIVRAGGNSVAVGLDSSGRADLPAPMTGQLFTLSLRGAQTVTSFDPFTRTVETLPVGVSEVQLSGANAGLAVAPDATSVAFPCGSVKLEVGGVTIPMTSTATVGALRRLLPLEAVPCQSLPAGGPTTSVRLPSVPGLRVEQLVIRSFGGTGTGAVEPVALTTWGPVDRALDLPAREGSSVLVVHENANPGWTASLAGRPLEAIVVDGWQQGWVVPEGPAGRVSLHFLPDRGYRLGLAVGLLAALWLVVLALVPSRRRARPSLPAPPASWPAPAVGALLAVAGLAVLGPWGVLVGFAGWLTARMMRRRAAVWPALVALGLLSASGVLLAARPAGTWTPYGGNAPAPQLLVLAAFGAAVAGARGTRWRRPWTGRSRTKRLTVATETEPTTVSNQTWPN